MLTPDQKERIDEAGMAHQFRKSDFYRLVKAIVKDYRETCVYQMEHAVGPRDLLEWGRKLQAANEFRQHMESKIEEKIGQIDQVAAEVGVGLDELSAWREISG